VPTPTQPAFHPELTDRRRWAILICFVCAASVAIMSQLTMTTCLPAITAEFGVSTAQGQWLTTSYMIAMGVTIPCTGYLMTRFPSRVLFLASNLVFLLGFLGAFAGSFAQVVAVRCIQGLAAGVFIPLMQVICFRLFAPERRGFAMGVASVALAAGPVLGPVVAGTCTDLWGWRSVFVVVAVLTALSLVSYPVVRGLVERPGEAAFDVASLVLAALAFAGIVVGAGSLGTEGMLGFSLLLLALGAGALALFVRRQRRLERPFLDLAPLRDGGFALGIAAVAVVFGTLINVEVFMSVYIQNDQGFSPTVAALCLMPGAVLSAVLSPFTGRILDARGPLALSVVGFACLVVAGAAASCVAETTPLAWSAAVFALRSVGNACTMQNLQTWAVNRLPAAQVTAGTSIAVTARQVGGALVNTLLFALMGALAAGGLGELGGIRVALAVSTALVALCGAAVVAYLYRARRA
jgi:EmrB/QacA subfamily drug resistance transporter